MANGMVGAIADAALKGAIEGGSHGSGLISAPFKAARTGGNFIKGITKNLHSFDKRQAQKSRFKKINSNEPKIKNALGIRK